jgi:hypothetical protein
VRGRIITKDMQEDASANSELQGFTGCAGGDGGRFIPSNAPRLLRDQRASAFRGRLPGTTCLGGSLVQVTIEAAHSLHAAAELRAAGSLEAAVELEAAHSVEAAVELEAARSLVAAVELVAARSLEAAAELEAPQSLVATGVLEAAHSLDAAVELEAGQSPEVAVELEAFHSLGATVELQAAHSLQATVELDAVLSLEATVELQAALALQATVELEAAHSLVAAVELAAPQSLEAATAPEVGEFVLAKGRRRQRKARRPAVAGITSVAPSALCVSPALAGAMALEHHLREFQGLLAVCIEHGTLSGPGLAVSAVLVHEWEAQVQAAMDQAREDSLLCCGTELRPCAEAGSVPGCERYSRYRGCPAGSTESSGRLASSSAGS